MKSRIPLPDVVLTVAFVIRLFMAPWLMNPPVPPVTIMFVILFPVPVSTNPFPPVVVRFVAVLFSPDIEKAEDTAVAEMLVKLLVLDPVATVVVRAPVPLAVLLANVWFVPPLKVMVL